MKTIKAFVKSHALLCYFALAFAISWGAVLTIVGPGILDTSVEQVQTQMLLALAIPAMLLGPSVAGIVLTGLLYGRAGFRELRSRMLRWRVDARWWAVALLTAPLSMTAVLLALSLTSPGFLPGIFTSNEKTFLMVFGIGWGLVVGIFEELGWTGFAIPRMRLRYGVLSTGLIVGLLWGAWHFLVNFCGIGSSSGALPPALMLLVLLFSWLPPYRVLMVWVYDRTGESMLLAMLMHASLVASMFILVPLTLAGVALLTYDLVLAAALWVVVGVVAVANGGHLSLQPFRRRVA